MMNQIKIILVVLLSLFFVPSRTTAQRIDPTWESLSENNEVPQWFVNGRLAVWFHWGISSASDEIHPNDGSPYGRGLYCATFQVKNGKQQRPRHEIR